MPTATNIGEINGEVAARCSAFNLPFHCGGDGIFGAKIAVISDYPGERERQLKQPMVGCAGKIFWDAVRGMGLNRRNVYVTNVVKRQVKYMGQDEKAEVASSEAQQYASILQWELSQLPNLQ